jgi:hypothetical protein
MHDLRLVYERVRSVGPLVASEATANAFADSVTMLLGKGDGSFDPALVKLARASAAFTIESIPTTTW